MDNQKIKIDPNAKPKAEAEKAPPGFNPTSLLSKIDELEKEAKWLKQGVDFVKGTNWFILAVLFMGFITLLASFLFGIIQSFQNNTNSQIEFIKSVDKLSSDLNKFSNDINRLQNYNISNPSQAPK